ncbi:hypothetical protein RSOLAG1IB_09710 [Rhizoctonia solani AG-1 IB]|uniref:Uncharacterized protein n=1 Tax=Thanatephorus cucumeris (strain AG1-IB / isolate 7/3/14) TaxID=1108050 RepID=A0A0B7FWB5_THACB|nr:hypothetical protein RSOLAG1IB_09710 [Rhizoctonia solani AG-1 IB]
MYIKTTDDADEGCRSCSTPPNGVLPLIRVLGDFLAGPLVHQPTHRFFKTQLPPFLTSERTAATWPNPEPGVRTVSQTLMSQFDLQLPVPWCAM